MRPSYIFRAREKTVQLGEKTRIMGVVNITPDSFFDGGRFLEDSRAIEHCVSLAEAGADIVDLGGESSRPRAEPVSEQQELERLLPVLREVRKRISVLISVDTCKSAVAREALNEGADIINDISAFRCDPEMPRIVKQWDAGVVVMHMRGTPKTMQDLPLSPDILEEIHTDLGVALSKASENGIAKERIIIDPGIGFGKNLEDNCRILNNLSFLKSFRLPILVGTSRKSFLGKILNRSAGERIWGTAASVAVAILRGAHVVRVHDVTEMKQVVQVTDAILAESLLKQ
jgi:dihydropteroate synthase